MQCYPPSENEVSHQGYIEATVSQNKTLTSDIHILCRGQDLMNVEVLLALVRHGGTHLSQL